MGKLNLLAFTLILTLVCVDSRAQCLLSVNNTTPCPGETVTALLNDPSPDCNCSTPWIYWSNGGAAPSSTAFITVGCDDISVLGQLSGCHSNPPYYCSSTQTCGPVSVSPRKLSSLMGIAWSHPNGSGIGNFSVGCMGYTNIVLTMPDWTCGGLTYQWDALPVGWVLVSGTLTSRSITVKTPCFGAATLGGTITHPLCGSVRRDVIISRHADNPLPFNFGRPAPHCGETISTLGNCTFNECGTHVYNWRFVNCTGITAQDGCGAEVTFDQPGTATVCRTLVTACGNSQEVCATFTIGGCKPAWGYTRKEFEDIIGVYPNPTSKILNIEIPTIDGVNSCHLVDAAGRTVRVLDLQYKISLDVSELPSGFYYLQVETGEFTTSKKIEILK